LNQKITTNLLASIGLVLFSYLVLFVDSFITYRKKGYLFETAPFQTLFENGFETELLAINSKFLFVDRRLTGRIDNYQIKVDGNSKRISVIIGIDISAAKIELKDLKTTFSSPPIDVNDFFIEKTVKMKDIRLNSDLLATIRNMVMSLQDNNIPARI